MLKNTLRKTGEVQAMFTRKY